MSDIVIHDAAKDRWHILLDNGTMLDWNNREWMGVTATIGANTITQDEDGNQLTTVTFPTKKDAAIGVGMLELHRRYVAALLCLQASAEDIHVG